MVVPLRIFRHFELGQVVYHQILGTAICRRFALSYAIIFMGELEEGILSNKKFQPQLWLRYLDDTF